MKKDSTATAPNHMADYFLGQGIAPKTNTPNFDSFADFFKASSEDNSEIEPTGTLLKQELKNIIDRQETLTQYGKSPTT